MFMSIREYLKTLIFVIWAHSFYAVDIHTRAYLLKWAVRNPSAQGAALADVKVVASFHVLYRGICFQSFILAARNIFIIFRKHIKRFSKYNNMKNSLNQKAMQNILTVIKR